MRILLIIGVVLLVAGLLSLFIPIPQRERHGIDAGGLSVGIETTTRQKVHPAVSAVLIGGGVALMIAAKAGRRR
ncbi:MAG TPA: hypothetical protein VNA69_24515 [Thermoanaerobaculia bacterium]|nr:hypothetical protein [Thermoanaerobaculia bacterium]